MTGEVSMGLSLQTRFLGVWEEGFRNNAKLYIYIYTSICRL